jgi:hypothetical protein
MPAKESSAEVTQDARSIAPETTWMGEPSFRTAYVRTSHGAMHGQESEKPQDASKRAFPCLVECATRGVFELGQIHEACACSRPFHSTGLHTPHLNHLSSTETKGGGFGTVDGKRRWDYSPLAVLGIGYLLRGPARSVTLGKIMIMNYINGYWAEDWAAVDPRDSVPPNQKSMAQSRKECAA